MRHASMDARQPHLPPDSAENPDSDADEDEPDEPVAEKTDALVEEAHEKTDEIVGALNSNIESTIEATVGGRSVHVQTNRVPKPPRPPQHNTRGIRSGFSDRSRPQAQILTGIMLAGVVLAGYFFLNANTRGHYTWRLRIGSTLVFIASLVFILLVTNSI